MKQRIILVLVAVATVALTAAPAALAVSSSVRIQGATFQVLPTTVVNESAAGGKIVDTDGTSFTTTNATALGATAAALQLGGLPWDMSIGTYGPYINSIDGLAMAGDYSNWWEIVVNGYSSPVGAGSLQTVAGDSYLWFQNPDATGIKPAFLLVTRVTGGTAKRGFTPGPDRHPDHGGRRPLQGRQSGGRDAVLDHRHPDAGAVPRRLPALRFTSAARSTAPPPPPSPSRTWRRAPTRSGLRRPWTQRRCMRPPRRRCSTSAPNPLWARWRRGAQTPRPSRYASS